MVFPYSISQRIYSVYFFSFQRKRQSDPIVVFQGDSGYQRLCDAIFIHRTRCNVLFPQHIVNNVCVVQSLELLK